MRYLAWALLALGTYTFLPPLMQVTTARVSTGVATFVAAGMLSLTGLLLALNGREPIFEQVASYWPALLLTGLALSVGVTSFFIALSRGPVSVVSPIFGLFLVTSSVIGGLFLGESLSTTRIAGLLLAIVAIVLISVE